MRRKSLLSTVMIVVLMISLTSIVNADLIKKSKSNICHDSGSQYYSRTKNFEPYSSLDACLKSGGRLPGKHSGQKSNSNKESVAGKPYDREKYFGQWLQHESCMNTRHELLKELSTSTIDTGKNKCTVERGRWLDPYTGKLFYNAKDLQVDHLVPLNWAWKHGADRWDDEKRRRFANDTTNLFAVESSVNQQKSDSGPLEWLPPNTSFHCQYVTRFQRVVIKYDLSLSAKEKVDMQQLLKSVCRR